MTIKAKVKPKIYYVSTHVYIYIYITLGTYVGTMYTLSLKHPSQEGEVNL